ncbi:MAG: hypothetical protein LBC63_09750 [Holophagales bacterium]|nr:hypothetical protein [Holophagales bacterium]
MALALFLPWSANCQSLAIREGGFKVIGVDQTGKPPYTPEGRVYRIAGGDVSWLKPGDVLTLHRPKEERSIGTLRIISVQLASATARLDAKGEAFPLIGDVALPLAAVGTPGVSVPPTKSLKLGFHYPMQPVMLPQMVAQAPVESKHILPPEITKPYQEIVAMTEKIKEDMQRGVEPEKQREDIAIIEKFAGTQTEMPSDKMALPKIANEPPTALKRVPMPETTKPIEEVVARAKKIEEEIKERAQRGDTAEVAAALRQNAFYFQPGSSALSPIGLENLKRWTSEWGTKGATYYLKVPSSQLKLEKLLLDRLQALEKELLRLGAISVEYRAAEDFDEQLDFGEPKPAEPYDSIYVGAEIEKSIFYAGTIPPPAPASAPLSAKPPAYQLDELQPEIIEQFPIYFLPNSSTLSPKGVERLHQWVKGWGTDGTKYFLSVPQDQVRLDKMLIERLAALQKELGKLGIAEVAIRPDETGKPEPYETIYLGVEVWNKQ